ncbi:MAG: hypothetical protein WDZ64_00845 [Parcubacteria group bacterium]
MATNGKRGVVVAKKGGDGRAKTLLHPLPFTTMELEISDHLYYTLREVEVNEVFVLTCLSEEELAKMGLSSALIKETKDALGRLNLRLGMRNDEIVEIYKEKVYT